CPMPKEQRGRFTPVGKPQLTNRLFPRGGLLRPAIPQVMDYKKLLAFEKIEQVRQYRPYREERQYMATYLKALRQDNQQLIGEYESFGDCSRQIIMNRREYDRGMLFGFTEKHFSQYGWLQNGTFTDREEIKFFHKQGWAATNHLTIGRGENGKWAYGVSYSTGGCGFGSGLSVWGKIFDNRKDCLKAALIEILDGHRDAAEKLKNDTCGNFNAQYSKEVVRQVKNLLDELTGRKAVQLELF
ncbi:MAG: hypothetical protein M1292_08455, partial [Bacteroidetes bacterium]|nr:hypothetical protein [Bacteroidota bacterium]